MRTYAILTPSKGKLVTETVSLVDALTSLNDRISEIEQRIARVEDRLRQEKQSTGGMCITSQGREGLGDEFGAQ
jgi:hypothetical protein